MEIKKIRLSELEEFANSTQFQSFENKPITTFRVASQIKNPRAQPNDYVLYMGFVDDKLVAYRTLFGDHITKQGKTIRFGWCSGAWVHPGFRKEGFSTLLLNEAFDDWEGKLMFTNYAPEA